ncbi:MAG: hypothetical protein AB7U73_10860, partial [Pirellulales bacterium]
RSSDLIGEGCDCLIPSQPPKEAIDARREQANRQLRPGGETGKLSQPRAKRQPAAGYRPQRKTSRRRNRG